jgi:hypothetical protein
MSMNKPHILLPLSVTGLVLAAALSTAALVNATEVPRQSLAQTAVLPAKVNSLFEIAPLSVQMRCKLIQADPVLQQAEVAALFDVAPLTVKMRSKLVRADAGLQQAEVAALFDVERMHVPSSSRAVN